MVVSYYTIVRLYDHSIVLLLKPTNLSHLFYWQAFGVHSFTSVSTQGSAYRSYVLYTVYNTYFEVAYVICIRITFAVSGMVLFSPSNKMPSKQ